MLTKSTLKLIHSLESRKGRRREGLFVAEGPKLVGELLDYFTLRHVFFSSDLQLSHSTILSRIPATLLTKVTPEELSRASLMQTPQGILAIFDIPKDEADFTSVASTSLTIALDDVQDPGNLGTIVRLADWFGVQHLWCTPSTADIWNPKAIQATMGGIARVRVHLLNNLHEALADLPSSVPIYGTSLQGDILWQSELSASGVIIMGNEGRGISPEVDTLCTQRLFIPNFPLGQQTTDSLNVAMATGIVLAEFRRRLS